jgi:hypothetical protein
MASLVRFDLALSLADARVLAIAALNRRASLAGWGATVLAGRTSRWPFAISTVGATLL